MKRPRLLTLLSLSAAVAGVILFVYLFTSTDVVENLQQLPAAFLLMVPLIGVSFAFGTLSWARSFPAVEGSRRPPFGPLFTIRLAGEAINNALASAYVAGEPVKGLLATRYGATPAAGLASALIGKTTFVLGEVCFLLIGVGVAAALFGTEGPVVTMLITVSGIGLLVVAVGIFVQQRRLVGRGARLLKALRVGPQRLWRRAMPGADAIDAAAARYYARQRTDFFLSTGWATAGWLFGTVEVWAFLRVATPTEDALLLAVVLESGIAVAKGLSFFIPGSIGAQEGGIIWLFTATGVGSEAGVTYAVFRRFREIVWHGLGFAALWWLLRRVGTPIPDEAAAES